MKNKLALLFLLITSIVFSQSDSLINTTEIVAESQEILDTVSSIKADVIVDPKFFEPNFQEKYKKDEFEMFTDVSLGIHW